MKLLSPVFVAMVLASLPLFATPRGTHAAGVVDVSGQPCTLRSVAGATNQAGLVVKFDDGRTLTFCIEFTEESITGVELLRRSGLSVVTASSGGLGAAVCSIDGEGCNDPGDCFCQCKGGACEYWAYFQMKNGSWQYSPVGAGNRTIRNGDADAWVWGGGNSTPGGVSPDCAPAATATPQPTSTPRLPTATPVPSSVPPTPIPPEPGSVPTSTPVFVAPTLPPPTTTGASTPAFVDVAGAVATATASRGSVAPIATSTSPMPTEIPPQTQTPRTGVIRVRDAQGDRNASANSAGDAWSWRGTLVFVGFASVLVAVGGGALYWRHRAGG